MGVYFPEDQKLETPKGAFPFYLKSVWITLEVNWDEETITFVNYSLPENKNRQGQ
jgi:hypothetical protein